MRSHQNKTRALLGACLTWGLLTNTAHSTITPTPPIVDTDPPSAIVVPTDAAYNRHTTNGQPVTSLNMGTEVVGAGIVVTDDTDTVLDADTGVTGFVGPLPPGKHLINWKGTDPGSNEIETTQEIHVLPAVSFGIDQTVGEGNAAVTVTAYLSGPAPIYPVEIPYTIDDANSSAKHANGDHDHIAASGTIEIPDAALSGSITFQALDTDANGEDDEVVVFEMTTTEIMVDHDDDIATADIAVDIILGQEDRVSVGSNTQHTITITETNSPPVFDISAAQGGKTTRTVTTAGGLVTLTTIVKDPDGQTPTYDWSASDNALVPTDGTKKDTFTFSPAALTSGFYTARLTAIDSEGATTTRDFVLKVITSAPELSTTEDTDDDGQADSVDDDTSGDGSSGYQDFDNDGIRNYQDGVKVSSSLQAWDLLTFDPQQIKGNTHVVGPITFEWSVSTAASNLVFYPLLLRTEEGLKLSLGPTAFANDKYFARLDLELAKNYWGASLDEKFQSTDGQVIDVEISNLPHIGASVYLVIPQPAGLPPSNDDKIKFRVLSKDQTWNLYDSANGDIITTAAKDAASYCPPPKDGSYVSAPINTDPEDNAQVLPADSECVQLLIKDGGANDYDGIANGVIRLMGAPFINVEDPPISNVIDSGIFSSDIDTKSQTLDRNTSIPGGGASGAIGAWFTLTLLGGLLLRLRDFRRIRNIS